MSTVLGCYEMQIFTMKQGLVLGGKFLINPGNTDFMFAHIYATNTSMAILKLEYYVIFKFRIQQRLSKKIISHLLATDTEFNNRKVLIYFALNTLFENMGIYCH